MRDRKMKGNRGLNTSRKTFVRISLAGLIAFLAVCAVTQTYGQAGSKKWVAIDVKQTLSKLPWTSTCCFEFHDPSAAPSTRGITASIVSAEAVRQALVGRLRPDKRYGKLDSAHREDIDQRIASCLNQKFDDFIVFSFSYGFSDFLDSALTSPDQIHLLASDGTKIAGQLVPDASSIEVKCGWLPDEMKLLAAAGGKLRNEIAFPRSVDGRPTISPTDKAIHVVVDFHKSSGPVPSAGELDFDVDKLVYQGKPDF
jgi:hypothetical protein